jgi:hypothetical protein
MHLQLLPLRLRPEQYHENETDGVAQVPINIETLKPPP